MLTGRRVVLQQIKLSVLTEQQHLYPAMLCLTSLQCISGCLQKPADNNFAFVASQMCVLAMRATLAGQDECTTERQECLAYVKL